MCGIFGFAGQTTKPEKLRAFMTRLAIETSERGTDATGFAALTEDGHIIGSKAPKDALEYVATDATYDKVWEFSPTLMVGHCRWSTHGHEKENKNNHPFRSKDGQLAIVHNGIVLGHKKLASEIGKALHTECDSEVILRVIENTLTPDCEHPTKRMVEACQILENHGAGFAVLVLDKRRKCVWGFRNYANPLVYWESKALGVTVFASESFHIAKAARATLGRRVARALHKKAVCESPNPGYVIAVDTRGVVRFSDTRAKCDSYLTVYRDQDWIEYCAPSYTHAGHRGLPYGEDGYGPTWMPDRYRSERERKADTSKPSEYEMDTDAGQVKLTED